SSNPVSAEAFRACTPTGYAAVQAHEDKGEFTESGPRISRKGGRRFSEKDMRQRMNLARIPMQSGCALAPLEHECEFARMQVVEDRARALVHHVGIEPVGLQQGHPALPVGPLELEAVALYGELGNLLVDV